MVGGSCRLHNEYAWNVLAAYTMNMHETSSLYDADSDSLSKTAKKWYRSVSPNLSW